MVTQYLARKIALRLEFTARLRVEIFSAYELRTTDSQTNLSNGAVQVLMAGINIAQMPESSKVTYENTPRSRTLSSHARQGVPSGCATMGEEAYRREISDIDGPYSASLGRLRKQICSRVSRALRAWGERRGLNSSAWSAGEAPPLLVLKQVVLRFRSGGVIVMTQRRPRPRRALPPPIPSQHPPQFLLRDHV